MRLLRPWLRLAGRCRAGGSTAPCKAPINYAFDDSTRRCCPCLGAFRPARAGGLTARKTGPSVPPQIGRMDRYVKGKLLGKGSFGSAWLAAEKANPSAYVVSSRIPRMRPRASGLGQPAAHPVAAFDTQVMKEIDISRMPRAEREAAQQEAKVSACARREAPPNISSLLLPPTPSHLACIMLPPAAPAAAAGPAPPQHRVMQGELHRRQQAVHCHGLGVRGRPGRHPEQAQVRGRAGRFMPASCPLHARSMPASCPLHARFIRFILCPCVALLLARGLHICCATAGAAGVSSCPTMSSWTGLSRSAWD
jgi:hypothetical protein